MNHLVYVYIDAVLISILYLFHHSVGFIFKILFFCILIESAQSLLVVVLLL